MEFNDFVQIGAMMEQGQITKVNPDARDLTCIVVDGVEGDDLRGALLRSQRLNLKESQVRALQEYIVIGAHDIQPRKSGYFAWTAGSLHGTIFAPSGNKRDMLRLMVQLHLRQLKLGAPKSFEEDVAKARRVIETECQRISQWLGRLDVRGAMVGKQVVADWEQTIKDLDLDQLPAAQCETYVTEEREIRQRPFQHQKAIILVEGANADDIRSSLRAGRKMTLDDCQIHVMSQFLMVAAGAGGHSQVGIARGSTHICRDLLKLLVQQGTCDIEWRTFRKLDTMRWSTQRAAGAGQIMAEMAQPMLRVIDEFMAAWRAERKAERRAVALR